MNEIKGYKFKVGDEVVTIEGVKGKITDICTCEKCEERGFYEPIWVDDYHYTHYITKCEAELGFYKYYKIGEYLFNDFDKASVLSEMASYERELQILRKQLKVIDEFENRQ